MRLLGIPTVVDRLVQQAINQVMTPIYENQFSKTSYGFRPRRGCHDALRGAQRIINEGYIYVVDLDLERFFDTVSHSKLIEILSRTIKDGRVVSLIHKYLLVHILKRFSPRYTAISKLSKSRMGVENNVHYLLICANCL